MHAKIEGIKTEEDLVAKMGDNSNTIEREFKTGEIGIEKKGDVNGKRFKIVVEHGQLYLDCIDSFEEVFEVNRKMYDSEKTELTSILSPYMF